MFNLPKWLVNLGVGLLVVLLALLAIDRAVGLSNKITGKKPDNTLSVSAEGKVKATPDLATVNLGVITQGTEASKVQDDNSKKINKIVEFVKKQGITKDDISTSQFNIYPQYNYSNGKNEIIGYQLDQTITVKVRGVDKSTEILGKILSGAVSEGANQIYGVALGFDDPDNLRQKARELAIEKAKEKAKELAKVAGIKLGKVISVSEAGSGGYPMPYYGAGFGGGGVGLSMEKSVSPNVEPGSQDVIENMSVTFEVK